MAQSKLKIAEVKSPEERTMDEIKASWEAWVGDRGQHWTPVEDSKPLNAQISASLDKGRYVADPKPYIPFWRRVLRRLKGIRS